MSTMYNSNRFVDIKGTIPKTDCMYSTERFVNSESCKNNNNNTVKDLSNCENQLNEAIVKRKMGSLEKEMDRCLVSVDKEVLNKALNKAKSAPKAKKQEKLFGDNLVSKLDIVFQINPMYNPKLLLKTISSLINAGKSVTVRQHLHSSVPLSSAQKSVSYFEKLMKEAGNIKIDRNPGRSSTTNDFIFSFLITESLPSFLNIDATIHSANFASIHGDVDCARMIFELAGGCQLTEEDYYWSDLIGEALDESSLMKSVKGQVMKNCSFGGFAEICKGVL